MFPTNKQYQTRWVCQTVDNRIPPLTIRIHKINLAPKSCVQGPSDGRGFIFPFAKEDYFSSSPHTWSTFVMNQDFSMLQPCSFSSQIYIYKGAQHYKHTRYPFQMADTIASPGLSLLHTVYKNVLFIFTARHTIPLTH